MLNISLNVLSKCQIHRFILQLEKSKYIANTKRPENTMKAKPDTMHPGMDNFAFAPPDHSTNLSICAGS